MSILETLASLPQVNSRRVAQDIIAELESRGLRIAEVEPIDINERLVWDYDRHLAAEPVGTAEAARAQTRLEARALRMADERWRLTRGN